MKLTAGLSKEQFLSFYYEKRDYLVPLGAIVASFLLFFVFLVPQLLAFPAQKSETDIENQKLRKITEAKKIIESANNSNLDSKIKTAVKVLPADREFEGILSGINTAAGLSNSRIQEYKFTTGEVESLSASKYPFLEFKISISGGPTQTIAFIKELYKTFPISEVTEISISESISIITALFYYKPLPLEVNDLTQIRNLNPEESSILSQVEKWNESSQDIILETGDDLASSSAETTTPF